MTTPSSPAISSKSPRGYIQRGAETFRTDARQLLFRFMIDSREEIAGHERSGGACAQQGAEGSRARTPIVEDSLYLGGFHELE